VKKEGGDLRRTRGQAITAVAATAALVAWLSFGAGARAADSATLVVDAKSGRVIHADNAEAVSHPASLTKMMTLYLIFERLQQGRLRLDTKWRASANAARQPPSKLGLKEGHSITVHQAILAMITKSANDVATTAAESLAGSERNFALAMSAKAMKLGMPDTVFRNASGLPHPGQVTSARDMATLALALQRDFPRYYHYFSAPEFSFGGVTHRNHNALLGSYEGADGIKTGYIRASGFNLVASASRHGHRLIGVVMGGRSPASRNRQMEELLDKGFESLQAWAPAVRREERQVAAPPPAAEPEDGREWGIQVGAFRDPDDAEAVARKVLAMLPGLLQEAVVKVLPLEKNGRRPLYRARLHGITQEAARKACSALKKRSLSCLEVRLERGVDLAAAGG
jgi:D-alanyl-D-alanine carboxypeptidase